MGRLTGLHLSEFSIVRGADFKPANPQAVAVLYKATKQKGEPMKDGKAAAAEPMKKSLGEQIKDAVLGVLKAQTRTSTNTYSSESKSTEVWENDTPAAPEPTVVVVQQTEQVEKGAPVAAQAAPAQTAEPIDVAKAIETGMTPVVQMITKMDERLAAVESRSTGSRQVSKSARLDIADNSGAHFQDFTKYLKDVSGLTPGQKLTKATISSGGWSYGLSAHEANSFIDYIVDQSVLLKRIRTIRMPDKKYNIDKIGLGGKVLVKATPGVDPGDTVSVSGPTQVQLDAKEVIAIVSIGDDTLEDNIEGEAFTQHLLGMVSRAAANELDQAAIHGDTAVADTGILDRFDGYYKLAKDNGYHGIEAMADADRYWPGANGGKATRLLKALPTKYRQDYRNLAVILHNDLYLDYMDELASKGYSEAWQAITGMQDVPIRSIQNVRVPMLKTDMSFTYSSTPYTDGTFVMLTDLRNLIFGIHREIRIESQRWARKRATDYVITMRCDVQIENGDAIAIYDHAKVKA